MPSADTELKRKQLNLMLVQQISVENGVEPVTLQSSRKISCERIIESESLKGYRDLFGQYTFFRDEEIEKKSN